MRLTSKAAKRGICHQIGARYRARVTGTAETSAESGSLIIDAAIGISIIIIVLMLGLANFAFFRSMAYAHNATNYASSLGAELELQYNDTGNYPAAGTAAGQVGPTGLSDSPVPSHYKVTYGVSGDGQRMGFCIQHGSANDGTGTVDAYACYASSTTNTFGGTPASSNGVFMQKHSTTSLTVPAIVP